ncbi:MAG: hypothetical protein GXY15_09950 [Candidatus Hydrogenedentes bacterium]|nr:hypothetical protein [Candidatus Hydrogenedentota bacterium]
MAEFVRLGVTVVEAPGLDDYAALHLFRGGQLIGEVVFLPVEMTEEPEETEVPEEVPAVVKAPPEPPTAAQEALSLPPDPDPESSSPPLEEPESAPTDPSACEAVTDLVRHVLLTGGVPEDHFAPEGQSPAAQPPKLTVTLPPEIAVEQVAEWVESATAEYGFYLETYQGGPHRAILRVSQEHSSCLELVCVTEAQEPWAVAGTAAEPVPPASPPPAPLPEPVPPAQESAPPLVPAPAKKAPPAGGKGPVRVAIILDDGGWGGPETRRVLTLDNRLTLAILPNAPKTEALAREAAEKGFEVMLHMPMESSLTARKFPGQVETSMDRETIHRLAREAVAQVPGLVGVNNHTGTLFTQDAERMGWFMEVLREKNLYFVDSMTTAKSAAHAAAGAAGLKAARRDVFLDNDASLPYIRNQVRELVKRARTRGSAVAIGHFRRNTVTVLEEILPGLEKEGVVLTRMSELVQ